MRHSKTLFAVGLLAILLAACGAPQAEPTQTAVSSGPAVVQPTATNTVVVESPTLAPTATEAVAVDYCISCHTDKDQLILTAKIEEELPEESEGAG
jgi:mono/diheme cytochrome c family protein